MASSELQKRKREEYEIQLFGFHSRAVYETFKNIVESKIETQCQNLHAAIEKKYKLDDDEKTKLKLSIKKLGRVCIDRAQPYVKNIQSIVEKYISIPNNILLEEDKCQIIQYSDEEFKELNKKLEDLRIRLKRAHVLNIALNQEIEATNNINEFVESVNKVHKMIEKGLSFEEPTAEYLQVVKKYKILFNRLEIMAPETPMQIYNPSLEHINLKELVLDGIS